MLSLVLLRSSSVHRILWWKGCEGFDIRVYVVLLKKSLHAIMCPKDPDLSQEWVELRM